MSAFIGSWSGRTEVGSTAPRIALRLVPVGQRQTHAHLRSIDGLYTAVRRFVITVRRTYLKTIRGTAGTGDRLR